MSNLTTPKTQRNWDVFAAALQSVFPQSELGTFLPLQKRDKDRQLQELAMIVTGIRLYNKDCGKGGEGIDDCKHFFLCTYCLLYME